jgi:hypothetical protein
MMKPHSAIANAAYHDLLRLLQDEAVAAILGTPHRLNRNGRSYWYDTYRVGSSVQNRYLGEDSPEMAARVDQHAALAAQSKDRATERARLIRVLRAEGLPTATRTTGSMLAALEKSGAFRLGGTLVGTQAFRLYEAELGMRFLQTETLQTDDIDIAQFERLSLAVNDLVETPLAEVFKDLDFEPVPSAFSRSVWRWRQSRASMMIEFLTPSFRPEEDIRDLPALGVAAQSLHYLNYLIADPIKAAVLYRSGVLVQIPRPERYAVHKLIVADRRQGGPDQLKSRKDRAQAALLIAALAEDRPADLAEALADARSRGPNWNTRLDATLARMPQTAALLATLTA